MAPPAVSIVVPTYRRPALVARLLHDLAEQHVDGGFELVVADDGSGPEVVGALRALAAAAPFPVTVLASEENRGPAAARNAGCRAARGDILAFTDDDCRPQPGWLAAGVTALRADRALGLVQGRTDRAPGTTLTDWSAWRRVAGPSPFFEGCNIFYRRDALLAAGGFDETISRYGEDCEAGWRVVDAGWGRGFCADALVFHDVEERGLRWHLRYGLLERNLVGIARRHRAFRSEAFWRPWAFRRTNAAWTVAAVGVVVGLRWRPALLLAVPYLWWRRPPRGHARPVAYLAESVAVDSAQSIGLLAGSLQHRTLVL